MLTWQGNARSTYQPTERLEESRHYYATVRIQEFQRNWYMTQTEQPTFAQLLEYFRYFGEEYDEGLRLRDPLDGAA